MSEWGLQIHREVPKWGLAVAEEKGFWLAKS